MALPSTLDHLVYAVPDLDAAGRIFAELTGLEPVPGGSHPGRGTRNSLLRLDEGTGNPCYLELLGPDPDQPEANRQAAFFRFGELGTLFRPQLLAWALHPSGLDDLVARAPQAGVEIGQLNASSRRTPSGQLLSWRLTEHPLMPYQGLQPFLIDWGASPHPSASAGLPVARLVSIRAEHPQPEQLAAVYRFLGIGDAVAVRAALAPALVVVIDTPKGLIELR